LKLVCELLLQDVLKSLAFYVQPVL